MPDPLEKPVRSSRRILPKLLFGAACLLTLVAVFYAEENWRGKRAWETCRRELTAKGANLNWAAYIPPAVPDDQNIFKAPNIAAWFVRPRQAGVSNELYWRCNLAADCVDRQSTNPVADVTIVRPEDDVMAAPADVILRYSNSVPPSADAAQTQRLREAVRKVMWSDDVPPPELSLQGAQNYTLVAKLVEPARSLRVIVQSDRIPSPKEVAVFFPRHVFEKVFSYNDELRVAATGTNTFQVFLKHARTCAAADYLACTDVLAPQFNQIRNALKRPYARREGDYEHSWEIPFPNFVTVRAVAQTFSQRAQCHLLLGDPESALNELSLFHDLSRLLGGKPVTLVGAMINVAISGLYASVVADGLRLHIWQEPQLKILQRQLEAIQLLRPFVDAMDVERASACQLFEITGPAELENIFGFGKENSDVWTKIKDPTYWALRCMPRGWFYQNMTALAEREQAFIETIDTSADLVAPRKADDAGQQAIVWVNRFSPYAVLARVAMPNYLKASQTVAHNQTTANQGLVACALERYRLAHQDYPESLSRLIPEFLDKLPHDIINGQPMIYRRVESEHFLLYSVGWNAADDGGTRGKSLIEGDWVWEGNSPVAGVNK